MHKFDPTDWLKADLNEPFRSPDGELRLKATSPVNVFVGRGSRKVLAYSGQDCQLWLPNNTSVLVKGAKSTEVYLYSPAIPLVKQDPEVWTNIDRQPFESGTLLAVRQALREQEVRQASDMRALRSELRTKRLPAPIPAQEVVTAIDESLAESEPVSASPADPVPDET